MPTRSASTTNAIAMIDVTFVRNFEEPVPKVESEDPPKMPPSPWLFSSCTATRKMRTRAEITKRTSRIMLKTPIFCITPPLLVVCNDRQELLDGQ